MVKFANISVSIPSPGHAPQHPDTPHRGAHNHGREGVESTKGSKILTCGTCDLLWKEKWTDGNGKSGGTNQRLLLPAPATQILDRCICEQLLLGLP